MTQEQVSTPRPSSGLQVIVYWAVVGVPLGWGIYKTIDKSIPLFKSSTVTTVGLPVPTPGPSATVAPVAPPAQPINLNLSAGRLRVGSSW